MPILLAMLADGRLHLTAIAKLAPHLTRENREAVRKRATHCSKRQVEELAAELAPHPDAPALIRKLSERQHTAPARTGLRACPERVDGSSLELRPDAVALQIDGGHAIAPSEPGLGRDKATSANPETPSGRSRPVRGVALAPAPQAGVRPLSPGRYRVQFTASAGLRDKLKRLERLEARRFGLTKATALHVQHSVA